MSHVCHCGWSGSTYQGMRIHQGKKGCMPKGMSIPQSEYYSLHRKLTFIVPPVKREDPWIDMFKTDTTDSSSHTSLQICHCGWSNMTTYQGLRIHQGKMGCTQKGMRIPESEQYIWRDKWEDSYQEDSRPFIGAPVKEENVLMSPDLSYKTAAKQDSVMEMFNSLVERQLQMGAKLDNGHQDFTTGPQPFLMPVLPVINTQNNPAAVDNPVMDTTSENTHRSLDFSTGLQQPFLMPALQEINTHNNPAAADSPVKDTEKSFFETPQRTHQTVTASEKARRALDFSTGPQQVDVPKEKVKEKEKDKERETQKLQKARQDRMRADLQQKIRMREHKMTEFRSSVKACKGSLDAEWLEINSVFSEVMRAVEDARQEALQPLEERRRKVKKAERDLVQKLQREIDALRETIGELDINPDWKGPPLTSLDDLTIRTHAMVDTSSSFGTLRTTTSRMMKQIQEKLENLSPVELKRIPTFAVDIKLDPATAHQCLVLSDDGKKVRDGTKKSTVPDAPERFDVFGSVLGRNSLTSGKSYWEVEVSNKTGWDLGVARGNANRKGKLTLNPDNGYWITVHFEGKKYAAMTAPPVQLSLKEKPQKVGVFVDYEEGLVSFYDVTTQSHIYSFTECLFGGEIFPYFSPHLKRNEKNADPLIISSVQKKK